MNYPIRVVRQIQIEIHPYEAIIVKDGHSVHHGQCELWPERRQIVPQQSMIMPDRSIHEEIFRIEANVDWQPTMLLSAGKEWAM